MPQNNEKLTVLAPAKVNLHLAVGGRRPDGFHDIESVFLAVDFGDTLHFELSHSAPGTLAAAEIEMDWTNCPLAPNFELPREKNIIFRALSLFRAKTGFDQGLKITVEKRIPPGGGLGGGSSDAAATLLALDKLSGGRLRREKLLEMGTELGSDVPFFLYESPAAKVTGRGELIEPLQWPPCFVVLVNPGFQSDTAEAYRLLDEYRGREEEEERRRFTTEDTEFNHGGHGGRRRGGGRGEEVKKVTDTFYNDFLPVFREPEKSIYQGIISRLVELGAEFAGLSGSGSTCFGLFEENEQAQKAAASTKGTATFSKR